VNYSNGHLFERTPLPKERAGGVGEMERRNQEVHRRRWLPNDSCDSCPPSQLPFRFERSTTSDPSMLQLMIL